MPGDGGILFRVARRNAKRLGINMFKLAKPHHTHTVYRGIMGCHNELSGVLRDISIVYFYFFAFLEPYPRHMEVPGLRVESDLKLPVYSHSNAKSEPCL